MSALAKLAERVRAIALRHPETYEEQPWGDRVVKVRGKIFLFCGVHEGQLSVSVKLPQSGRAVLKEPWAKPTPYGLGKSGWVSMQWPSVRAVPLARLPAWIDESFAALAPKKLLAPQKPPATPVQKKIRARVLLLCQDALRTERALVELARRGVRASSCASIAEVKKRAPKLDGLIVDLGRAQDDGLALAAEIDAGDWPIHLFLVGIRDGRADKRAAASATSAERFRAPPGDPAVAEAIAATLARYQK
jgi:predicted DNA-binding protein (MmcQ/YjbR family)